MDKQKQDKRFKHGKTGTRLFNIWQNMKERCFGMIKKKYIDEICKEFTEG